MLSKLLLIMFLVSIQGEDWCKLVKPGGTYKGLGIYHHFELNGSHPDDYRMFNRDDSQWNVEVKVSGGKITLKNIENSSIPVSERNVINKFSTLLTNSHIACECIATEGQEIKAECKCRYGKDDDLIEKSYPEPKFKNSVIVKIYPSHYQAPQANYVLVFSKINKGNYFVFSHNSGKIHDCSKTECFVPQFINEIDSSLFKQIESVADININGTTGYLLLFTIDDKPKYCFTPENQTLSEECKTSDNMKPFYEECFPTEEPVTELETVSETMDMGTGGTDKTQSETSPPLESTSIGSTEEPSSGLVWVIIAMVFVILLIVAAIVIAFIFLQQTNTTKEKPSDQKTSGTSSGSATKAGAQSIPKPHKSDENLEETVRSSV